MSVAQINNYRRKKKKRKLKLRAVFIYFFILIIGFYFFIHSSFFNIKEINITGNNLLTAEKVVNLSQIEIGVNLFKINKNEIIKKISVHPLIKDVEIKRKLPNALYIIVDERKSAGLLVCEDGFVQVSENGYFLALTNEIGNLNIPVISGVEMESLPGPGKVIEHEGLKVALDILNKCSTELLKNLAEINVKNNKYIIAYTLSGIEVRLGTVEKINEKLEDLWQIIYDLQESNYSHKKIEYIDLRFSGPPVIKIKK